MLFILSTANASYFLRKTKSKDGAKVKCKFILLPAVPPATTGTSVGVDEVVNYFPEDYYSDNVKATANAKKQTAAGRALLAGPKGEVLAQLKSIGEALWNLNMNKLKTYWQDPNKTFENEPLKNLIHSDVNRQLTTGLLTIDAETGKYEGILSAIGKVKSGTADGNQVAAVVGLIGDFGALLFDFNNPAKKDKIKTNATKMNIMYGIAQFKFTGTKETALETLMKKVATNYNKLAGPTLYPNKQKERGNCMSETNKDSKDGNAGEKVPRVGLLSYGDTTIKAFSWPWQTLPKAVMDKCPQEPWMGHFSGSIVEQLFMLDLLAWDSSKPEGDPAQPDLFLTDYNKSVGITQKERKARVAIAAAHLIGLGMHSAVEIAPTIRYYLGQSPPTVPIATVESITSAFCGQTDYVTALIADINKP